MLETMLGETGGAIAQFVLALIFVVVLIVLVAWIIKRIGGGRFGASQSGKADLEIVDAIVVDQKRRLVLVRHGKLEHLLLIGGGSDEVIERSIIGGVPIAARLEAQRLAARNQVDAASTKGTAEDGEPEDAQPPASMPDDHIAEPKEPDMNRGAAAAAVTGLAAASATSGIAAAVSRSISPPPPVAPKFEAARRSEPIAEPSARPTKANEPADPIMDLEASIERALIEPAKHSPSLEETAVAEAKATETSASAQPPSPPEEFDLASELEAALSEQRGDQPAEPIGSPFASHDEPTTALEDEEPAPDDPSPALVEGETASPPEPSEPPAPPAITTADDPNFAVRPDPVPVTIPSRGPAAGAVTVNQAADTTQEETPALMPEPPSHLPAQPEPVISEPDSSSETEDKPAAPDKEAEEEVPAIDLGDLALPRETRPAESESTSDDLDEEMRRLLGEIAGAPPQRD